MMAKSRYLNDEVHNISIKIMTSLAYKLMYLLWLLVTCVIHLQTLSNIGLTFFNKFIGISILFDR